METKTQTDSCETESTRDRLIHEGVILFATHGYEATTTRMIAESVGSNNAAVFSYFGSKENYYEEVLTYVSGSLYEYFRPLREEILSQRNKRPLTETKAWYYIERYVDKYIALIKDPENQEKLYLSLHEQLNPANGRRPIAEIACRDCESLLRDLLIEYWDIDTPFSASIASRMLTSTLIAMAEHPSFLRTSIGVPEGTPLPDEAWHEIRKFAMTALRNFTPSYFEKE